MTLGQLNIHVLKKKILGTSHLKGLEDGSVFRAFVSLAEDPGSFLRTCMVPHNHPQFQFQGIQCPLLNLKALVTHDPHKFIQAKHLYT